MGFVAPLTCTQATRTFFAILLQFRDETLSQLRFGCHLHRGREIVRQRRFKIFPFTADRMPESNFPSVQHLSREILYQARRIDFIAENRMAEMMKMHTNLVGASAVQPALNQARPGTRAKDAVFGLGRPST